VCVKDHKGGSISSILVTSCSLNKIVELHLIVWRIGGLRD
jgi:hypothetical protein